MDWTTETAANRAQLGQATTTGHTHVEQQGERAGKTTAGGKRTLVGVLEELLRLLLLHHDSKLADSRDQLTNVELACEAREEERAEGGSQNECVRLVPSAWEKGALEKKGGTVPLLSLSAPLNFSLMRATSALLSWTFFTTDAIYLRSQSPTRKWNHDQRVTWERRKKPKRSHLGARFSRRAVERRGERQMRRIRLLRFVYPNFFFSPSPSVPPFFALAQRMH